VYRERNHIDLTLEYNKGERLLLIENKVKSLPTKEQLQEISKGVKKKDRAKTGFLLLTLVRPSFVKAANEIIQLDDGESLWFHITYGDLKTVLKAILPTIVAANSYHGELVKDYVDFIGNLDELQSYFAIDWDDDAGDFFITGHVAKQLRGIRLHDLVYKLRYEQLARRVRDVLRRDDFCVEHGWSLKANSPDATAPKATVSVDSGMTRGMGLANFKYVVAVDGDSPVMLVVELQANTLRLGLWMADKAKAEKTASALMEPSVGKRIWYDFGSVKVDEFPKKPKTFNNFNREFFYRSIRLERTSPKTLVETIVRYIRLIRDNEATIQQQLEKAL
jgi:hypothetical protein